MTFLEDVKAELSAVAFPSDCCRPWELRGFLDVWGQTGGSRVRIRTDSAAAARRFFGLARGLGAEKIKVARVARAARGARVARTGRRFREAYIVVALLEPRRLPAGMPRRRCCRRSYVRGAFLARGYLGVSSHGYHWEVKTPDPAEAEKLRRVMHRLGLRGARVGRWQKQWVVYLKDGEDIASWLGQVGAHGALLRFENTRVEKAMRSQVNRLVNYETANLSRTVGAALRQKEDIELIERTVGLGSLPEPLRELAEARLAQPLASLAELAQTLNPPLSKSGASHRMKRLAAIAARLRASQN